MDGVSREMQQHEKQMGIGRYDRYLVLKESIFGDEGLSHEVISAQPLLLKL